MSYVLQLVDSSIRTFNGSKHMVSYKFIDACTWMELSFDFICDSTCCDS